MKRLILLLAGGLLLATMSANAGVIAIRDARVITVGRDGTLARATVLIRNGRIEALGADLEIPAGAKIVEGAGRVLTPGLIVARSTLGQREIDEVDETDDVTSGQPRYSAALDVVDGLNPRSVLLPVSRIDGITRSLVAPDAGKGGSLIAGQGAIISLAGSLVPPEQFVVRPRAAMFAALGERGHAIAGSRLAALAALREAFEEAKGGGLRLSGGLSGNAQLSPLDLAALRPVLAGETPLVLSVDRASDILAALRLADDYGLQLVISGGAEAHLVAGELASRQVPVLLDPSLDLPARFELLHARPDAADLLARAGVRFAFIDSSDNASNLRQLAGIAVSHGLSRDLALAAITLQPAEILGLAGVLGSIEPGKIADLVLWDGDPLEVTTAATEVWIEGQAMPMISRQTLLRDRYRPKPQATP